MSKQDTVLLLDSDIIAYKFASANQRNFDWESDGNIVSHVEPLEDVVEQVRDYIFDLCKQLKADRYIVCLSCASTDNWRKDVLPSYKENRAGTVKPVLLGPIKDTMREEFECYERPRLEADDIMGILSTHPTLIPGKKIIVSEDKDMKTVPGWLFNPRKDEKPRKVSEEQADYFHLYQTLIGDTTDGYKGCPGIGPVKAEKILQWAENDHRLDNGLLRDFMWSRVVDAYESKGLTEEDALVQARVARICRFRDYDFKNKEVILWTP